MDHGLVSSLEGAAVAGLGLAVGSFANVAIFRTPLEGLTVSRPARSFCTSCGARLAWFDNLPVVSWVALGGRCRRCAARVSPRYPLVELLVAALVFGAWWMVGPIGGSVVAAGHFAVLAYLATTCVVVSLIDLEHLIIPDAITLPGLALGLVASVLLPSLHEGHLLFDADAPRATAAVASLAGALAGGGSLWAVGKLGAIFLRRQMEQAGVQDAMGLGDVKWMAHTGAFLGVGSVLGAIVAACFAGAAIGIALKLCGRGRHPLPFGPFLSLGILVELAAPGLAWILLGGFAQPA